jgi:carbamoylphosphate synthase small subunit
MSEKGYLIIETGDVLEGVWLGPQAEQSGELVFNTSMYVYQEILTDPSYKGQILCFCYPLIGNYGIHDRDFESETFHVSGVIIGEIIEAVLDEEEVEAILAYIKTWWEPDQREFQDEVTEQVC